MKWKWARVIWLLGGVLFPALAAATTNHWAFLPIRDVPPPAPSDPLWERTPIDRFISAKLKTIGGYPTKRAEPRALIRRLTLDLTGLPPSPLEVDAFERASRRQPESAWLTLVERLLASPHYGERWGRWWLDVARYADTNGQDENKVLANAWRYRDWVVQAFNANQSFDRFMVEQIAGDLLPPTADSSANFDRLIATGFLVLGPKMLAEQDKPKLVMDIIDEQLDTLGRTFLGLTLGCARCHDHKFDPIPARDYYALAGIFRSTRTMENLDFVSKFNERLISTPEQMARIQAHQRRLLEQTNLIAAVVTDANAALVKAWQHDFPKYLTAALSPTAPAATNLAPHLIEQFKRLLSADPGTNVVSRTLHDLATAPEQAAQLFEIPSSTSSTNAGLRLAHPDQPPGESPVVGSDFNQLSEADRQVVAQTEMRKVLLGPGGPFSLPKDPRIDYPLETRSRLVALEEKRDQLIATAPPHAAYALAVSEDHPIDLPIHLRGSHLNLAPDPISRGFLEVVNRNNPPPPIPQETSGRLELARWLVAPGNPLTARVMVNRVWQAHFGEGLVRTPDNFGVRGEMPSHPELLDWLAHTFIRSGWNLKTLHRLIVTSAVYQQSSLAPDASPTRSLDPDNRYLARFPRVRLEAEMIRDSLLAAAGRLAPGIGGSITDWKNNEYAPADDFSESSLRRTLYLPIVRDRVFDALTIFDFANPSVCSARRTPTVVSHQALFFLNSPLVQDSALALAKALLAPNQLDDAGCIQAAYQAILNRPARESEVGRAQSFLAHFPQKAAGKPDPDEPRIDALAAFCQTLLAANEFICRP